MPPIQMPPKVFDRALIARHLRRRSPDRDDFVTRLALADLAERLGTVTRDFEQALIMAPDASVLPTVPSANTYLTVLAAAELFMQKFEGEAR